jgi:hypothetical protein
MGEQPSDNRHFPLVLRENDSQVSKWSATVFVLSPTNKVPGALVKAVTVKICALLLDDENLLSQGKNRVKFSTGEFLEGIPLPMKFHICYDAVHGFATCGCYRFSVIRVKFLGRSGKFLPNTR